VADQVADQKLFVLRCRCPFRPAAAVQKLANPKEFFTACYHSLLCCTDTSGTEAAASSNSTHSSSGSTKPGSSSDKITQQLCVKAMAAAYSAHAGTIGPFEGVPHLLQLLDATQQRSLRHGLLLLVQALVAPKSAGDLSALNAVPAAASKSSLPNVAAGSGSTPSLSVSTAKAAPGGAPAAAAAAAANSSGTSTGPLKLSQLPPGQAAAVKAAKANGYLLLDHGGLQLLVDFVAGGHECTERRMAAAAAGAAGAAAAGAGHLITSISHAEVGHQH
jgi:DnaJ family protein C protein 13